MTGEDTTGPLVLAELAKIRETSADTRDRVIAIETGMVALRGLEERVRANESALVPLKGVDERVRALEISGAGVSTRLALGGAVAMLLAGAAVSYLAGVLFGG